MAVPLLPKPLRNLLQDFERLPGVGPKSAQRMVFALLHHSAEELKKFSADLLALRTTKVCRICGILAEQEICAICLDPQRDAGTISVVETPLDVLAVERTGEYRGRYHVLGGVISPLEHIGPDQLSVRALLRRVKEDPLREIMLALNPSTEGDTTALYLQDLLKDFPGKITRLARGLPTGSALEFADDLTIARSIAERREIVRAPAKALAK